MRGDEESGRRDGLNRAGIAKFPMFLDLRLKAVNVNMGHLWDKKTDFIPLCRA